MDLQLPNNSKYRRNSKNILDVSAEFDASIQSSGIDKEKGSKQKKTTFCFNIQNLPNYPYSIFNYYFEISRYMWLTINDYPYFNSKLYNFTGKIPFENLNDSYIKFDLEQNRLHHNSNNTMASENIMEKKMKLGSIINEYLFIPTSNFMKISNLMDLAISYHMPILILGPPESGKTQIIKKKLLTETDKNIIRFVTFNINFKHTIDHVLI